MSQHTPGPWTLDMAYGTIITAALEDRFGDTWESREVARMRATCVTERWEADARLIAAAPDLLTACIEALESIGDLTSDVDPRSWPDVRRAETLLRSILNAAIAKAEGKQ